MESGSGNASPFPNFGCFFLYFIVLEAFIYRIYFKGKAMNLFQCFQKTTMITEYQAKVFWKSVWILQMFWKVFSTFLFNWVYYKALSHKLFPTTLMSNAVFILEMLAVLLVYDVHSISGCFPQQIASVN